ncbi:superoxide dismutase family protein [Acrocarpospora catenulata]|uniref:superoxide dismutase family protein n=1 Tax=Acrocarpospora catenulata TaxID=2836182 RepID=UPI001BD9A376|nr:superoxide dismutase family protein [Acrocarpospora catenulata]
MNQRVTTLAMAATVGLGLAVAVVSSSTADAAQKHSIKTVIRNVQGAQTGELTLKRAASGKVRVTVTMRGLTPGWHGFHVHAVGKCDPKAIDPASGTPFFSAGPHYDSDARDHANHSGDFPPLLAAANGIASATFETDRFRLAQLTDADGSAVIVHAGPDNLANIPPRYHGPDADTLKAGDSGVRIACGVISAAKAHK